MPKHKRESLIYTVMMCFVMVLWMSVYNVTLHMGQFGVETRSEEHSHSSHVSQSRMPSSA